MMKKDHSKQKLLLCPQVSLKIIRLPDQINVKKKPWKCNKVKQTNEKTLYSPVNEGFPFVFNFKIYCFKIKISTKTHFPSTLLKSLNVKFLGLLIIEEVSY